MTVYIIKIETVDPKTLRTQFRDAFRYLPPGPPEDGYAKAEAKATEWLHTWMTFRPDELARWSISPVINTDFVVPKYLPEGAKKKALPEWVEDRLG